MHPRASWNESNALSENREGEIEGLGSPITCLISSKLSGRGRALPLGICISSGIYSMIDQMLLEITFVRGPPCDAKRRIRLKVVGQQLRKCSAGCWSLVVLETRRAASRWLRRSIEPGGGGRLQSFLTLLVRFFKVCLGEGSSRNSFASSRVGAMSTSGDETGHGGRWRLREPCSIGRSYSVVLCILESLMRRKEQRTNNSSRSLVEYSS